ncbi:NADPH:quinone oxidoreductase family protein [Burkholderiaceae bacterium UC74_6]
MKAWICQETSGPEALQWADVPAPEPKPGEVRVRIRAASLNFPDLLMVQGKYQMKPPLPFVPGCEFAGHIDALGEGIGSFSPGQPVASFGGLGAFAEQACVDARTLMLLPPGFALEDAAAFICTYGTTHHALMDRAALQAGETVLVLGAAGGVGTAAIQIAKAAGARVIAAASTDEKCAACKAIGADEAINYATQDLREALKALTAAKGPDVVYDAVGGDLAEPAFRSIAWRGRYLVIGFAGGSIPALPLNLALLKGASIVGVFWGEFAKREPARNAKAMTELAGWYTRGLVRPVIDRRLPMGELKAAFARMASRQVVGKVLLLNEA